MYKILGIKIVSVKNHLFPESLSPLYELLDWPLLWESCSADTNDVNMNSWLQEKSSVAHKCEKISLLLQNLTVTGILL